MKDVCQDWRFVGGCFGERRERVTVNAGGKCQPVCLELRLHSCTLLTFCFELMDGRAFCRGRSMGGQVSGDEFDERSEVRAGLSGFVGNVSALGAVESFRLQL